MAKLTVNYPSTPKGVEMEFYPHGVFKNGDTYEVEALEEDLVLGEPIVAKPKTSKPDATDKENS